MLTLNSNLGDTPVKPEKKKKEKKKKDDKAAPSPATTPAPTKTPPQGPTPEPAAPFDPIAALSAQMGGVVVHTAPPPSVAVAQSPAAPPDVAVKVESTPESQMTKAQLTNAKNA